MPASAACRHFLNFCKSKPGEENHHLENKKKLWESLILPVIFIAIALFVIFNMQTSKRIPSADAMFPTLSAIGLILSSIPMIIQSFRGTMIKDPIEFQPLIRVLIVAAVLFLYVLCLKPVGYLISTFVLCNVILLLIGYEKRVFGAVYSLILTLAVYGIFKVLLNVPLAQGIFGLS